MNSVRFISKLVILGGLSVGLMIALLAINGLVSEREGRQLQVEREIAGSYAGEQKVLGPLIAVTLEDRWVEQENNRQTGRVVEVEKRQLRVVRIYPEKMDFQTSLKADERRRGIFKARVFQSSGTMEGAFQIPSASAWKDRADVETRIVETHLILGVSDPRGLSEVPRMTMGEQAVSWSPGTGSALSGIRAVVDLPAEGTSLPFSLDLQVHGMGGLFVVPVASDNRVRMQCEWPHPSFTGEFLPMTREISPEGFTAEWRVNALATSARQGIEQGKSLDQLQSLGVRLIDPITPYPLTDRALKYGFLFIGITFAAFLLFEIIRRLRIHPIQYGFVGFAQAVFFLLLLSLSEHIRFGLAYSVATAATCLLLTFYIGSVLGALTRGLGFGALLVLLYGALYGLLQSEDHALMAGSVLLFGLLAAVMLLTRKVDWYALLTPAKTNTPVPSPPPSN